MKKHLNKRQKIDNEEYGWEYLQKLMCSLFPKRNNCGSENDMKEVFEELQLFGIRSKKHIRLFLKKYRSLLIAIDKEPMDTIHQRIYRKDLGDEIFDDCMRRQYWFCYPAFIRNAMEIEFGAKYEAFSNERDNV